MKSRFENLVVSGCSFTTDEHVPTKGPWNWASTMCADTGMTIHNLASAGTGNTHIANSVILYLSQHPELTPANTLVMAMWSGVGRIDFLMSTEYRSKRYADACYYNQYVVSVLGGHWWNPRQKGMEIDLIRAFSRTQSNHSFAVTSWLEMQKLGDFLTARNFVHRFTSFVNYGHNLIKGDALVVPFEQCLHDQGLTLDRTNWLPLSPEDHFGDWCRIRGLLTEDGFHPGADAPQRWPREVVMPVLQQQGILQ